MGLNYTDSHGPLHDGHNWGRVLRTKTETQHSMNGKQMRHAVQTLHKTRT